MSSNPQPAVADPLVPSSAKGESPARPPKPLGKPLNPDTLQPHKAMVPVHPNDAGSDAQQYSSSRPSVVGQHFRVGKKIGEGSFGTIYEGFNIIDSYAVAIKFEPRKSEAPQLRDEYKSYKILAGTEGIPRVFYYGQEGTYNCLVMELLGHSLEYLFDCCSRHFTIQSVALLAIQMITRVQSIHEHNLIYRDIKPDNFLIGRKDKSHIIYIVDFGMAKHYRDPKTRVHIPYRERKSLSGTARYMSINTHLGREQSRRDDLEALGNVLLYFLRGSLPWQGLKAPTNKLKYEKIGEKKQQVSILELCLRFPEEFSAYIYYVRKLGFEDTPDYGYLKGLFIDLASRLEVQNPFVFDWTLSASSSFVVAEAAASIGYSTRLGIFSATGQAIRRLKPGDSQLLLNSSFDQKNENLSAEARKASTASMQPALPSSLYATGESGGTPATKSEPQSETDHTQPKSSVVLFAGYRQQEGREKEAERKADEEGISSKPFKRKKRGFFYQLFSSVWCCFHSPSFHRSTYKFDKFTA
ncbi:Palmitoylated plasma membrane-bound casein kinase [Mitosporidium daphniae]